MYPLKYSYLSHYFLQCFSFFNHFFHSTFHPLYHFLYLFFSQYNSSKLYVKCLSLTVLHVFGFKPPFCHLISLLLSAFNISDVGGSLGDPKGLSGEDSVPNVALLRGGRILTSRDTITSLGC